eukprot:GEMP01088698.1.p1 GENE.GEMP01088698.1~~GEMP01088698.1.p1  ORF type:complete len:228 (+),score=49.63 GEMP01088698.1:12-695(+)
MSVWLLIFSVTAVVLPPWACDRILQESYGAVGWLRDDTSVVELCKAVAVQTLRIVKHKASAQPLCEEFQRRVAPVWRANPAVSLTDAQARACHGLKTADRLVKTRHRTPKLAVQSPLHPADMPSIRDELLAQPSTIPHSTTPSAPPSVATAPITASSADAHRPLDVSARATSPAPHTRAGNPTVVSPVTGFLRRAWGSIESAGSRALNFICDDECMGETETENIKPG